MRALVICESMRGRKVGDFGDFGERCTHDEQYVEP
jgi:hypothetical protein